VQSPVGVIPASRTVTRTIEVAVLRGTPGNFTILRRQNASDWPFAGLGRNSLATRTQVQFDLRVLKFFKVDEHGKLDFVIESFNVLNHTNVVGLNQFYGVASAPIPILPWSVSMSSDVPYLGPPTPHQYGCSFGG
jgi:hypothetical protein